MNAYDKKVRLVLPIFNLLSTNLKHIGLKNDGNDNHATTTTFVTTATFYNNYTPSMDDSLIGSHAKKGENAVSIHSVGCD